MESGDCNCDQNEFDSNEKHFKIALNALRASTSDTEKFCALLIIAKFLKLNKLTDEQISQIFTEIGWKFLYRLLLTDSNCTSIPDSCKGTIFQSISINILTCLFLTDLKLLDVPICIKLFIPLSKILAKDLNATNVTDTNSLCTKFASEATSIATTSNAQNACQIININNNNNNCNNGKQEIINGKGNESSIGDYDINKERNSKEETDLIYDILHCLDTFMTNSYTNREIITILNQSTILETISNKIIDNREDLKLIQRYERTFEKILSCQWSRFDIDSYNKFLTKVSNEFKYTMEKRKFELCNKIPIYLQHNAIFCSPNTNQHVKQWLMLITGGLYEILISRLSDELRNPAFKLAAALTESFNGLTWIQLFQDEYDNYCDDDTIIKNDCTVEQTSTINNNDETIVSNTNHKHPKGSNRLFLLLSRLVCVEINIELDNLGSNQIDYNLLASCFIILENIIAAIAMDENREKLLKSLSSDELYLLLTAIRETMASIINYLQIMYLQWDEINTDNEKCISILGCIRLLCYWITEETEALRKEIRDILPFLLKIFENEMRKGPNSEIPIREIILPAMQSLIENDNDDGDMKSIISHSNVVQLIDQYKSKDNVQKDDKGETIEDICDSLKNLLK